MTSITGLSRIVQGRKFFGMKLRTVANLLVIEINLNSKFTLCQQNVNKYVDTPKLLKEKNQMYLILQNLLLQE
jgi:hypothetical protein